MKIYVSNFYLNSKHMRRDKCIHVLCMNLRLRLVRGVTNFRNGFDMLL